MQNIISANSNKSTMGTREIAELIRKSHSNIKISAERLAESGVIGTLAPQEFIHNGNSYTEYLLCKRDSLILVAQNCPEFTAKIVDRWQELEEKSAFALPQSFAQALMLAAQQAEQIEKQQAALAIAAPKADALDRIALADGMLHLQAAGKALQQPPNKFIQWLREINWIYKRPGNANNYPRADKSNAGYMTVKAVTITQQDGTDRVREQTFITPKGLAKLSMMLGVQPEMIGG